MARRQAARKRRASWAPSNQGKRPQRHKGPECHQPPLPSKIGPKRLANTLDSDPDPPKKRPRRLSRAEKASQIPAANNNNDEPADPVEFWARQGNWPRQYFELDMEHLLARQIPLSSLARKRSNSVSSATPTPSDRKPREQKSTPYQDSRYETLLAIKGSFMARYSLGITDASKALCTTLLDSHQPVPADSLFRDDIFEAACQNIHNRNEARIVLDISQLIVPSAESLAIFGASHLGILIESVNAGWNNSVPLTGTRPQPDYSVAFRREAFTKDQLAKLAPFLGNFLSGDQSFFMGTFYQYFPFLSSEVKCGGAGLDVADRQNAHSMTLAVRGVAELFRLVNRKADAHRQILAFSVSHNASSVRIWGHYPVMADGKDIQYYRHPIHDFSFIALDGRDKWTAYRFVKNVYHVWMPAHFRRICSAIDQLPADLDFDVASPSHPEAGLSHDPSSHHVSQSDADSQPSNVGQQRATSGTSLTDAGATKRRKRVGP
ncbi:hypothetical protein OCS_06458 [Ophiocordyceps sinensis CO18]|uniref:DUF7924 domain-containing protein n=1 Tax=Ophiocordyceps sinensis (strain Co18 / CGMCC 3.14243) TaxID=911162 RepID=T4ZXG9_OPHSC|nr:hypothetical protein OCS_06458 [Ophiocordyceps sinensis CO18]